MADRRLKHAEIKTARDLLLDDQNGICPLCEKKFGPKGKQPALDHDHITGSIRDVLCLWCNGREGKIFNLARSARKGEPLKFLKALVAYHERHSISVHGLSHPSHKTEVEKRIARNKKARERRAKK